MPERERSNTNEGKGLKVTKSFSSRIGIPDKRPFDDWNRFQLVTVLVENNHVIRDENYMSLSILRSFAEAVFADQDQPLPRKPRPLGKEEEERRHTAALTIQNAYFASLISSMEEKKGKSQSGGSQQQQHNAILRAMHSHDNIGEPPTVPPSNRHHHQHQHRDHHAHHTHHRPNHSQRQRSDNDLDTDPAFRDDTFPDVEDMIRNVPVDVDTQLDLDDDDDTAVQNTVLEQEFIPPSVEYAQLYADYNHPRLGGLGGTKMPWLRTSTGRHCVSGGWGEQCDMFEERQVSELGRYGPGITNYFKFLKWAFWTFVFLSLMWLPIMIMNTFGAGNNQSAQFNDLAQTTVGNLGDTNHTKTLHLPGCTGTVGGRECELDKEYVALYYAYTDVLCTVVVIVGYLWLRYFEVKEAQLLDKNSLSASNYTVAVQGFATNTPVTEKELKTHFKLVTAQDVATVSIAYDNEKEIELYKRRGELMMSRLRCTREYQYYRSRQRANRIVPNMQEILFEVLSRRVEITASIRDIDRQTAKCAEINDKPLMAFVTFENAIASRLAIRAYNTSIWGYIRMKRSLFFNKARISVSAASEPSTIIWENLKYSKIIRAKRRLVSTIITLVLLGISAVANIVARGLEQNATSEGGDEFCPSGFFTLTDVEQQDMVTANPDVLHCYCDQFTLSEQANDSYCTSYARQNLIADLFVYLAAFVVLCTNGAISLFLSRISANYEKHHSADSMERSVFYRLFILKIINMGVLFLTMNFWVSYLKALDIEYDALQNFSTQWYKTIGVSLILVQAGNVFGPHLYKFYFYRAAIKKRKAAILDPKNGGFTQIDLNTLHLGPNFMVSHRYAQILADLFICFIFTAGMPILPIIGMFNFYTSYWVDKYLLLNYYRSPPRYKTNMGRSASALLPYAIVLHLVASIWMLGNKEIFHADSADLPIFDNTLLGRNSDFLNIRDKITQRHTFPLFVLLLLVLLGLLLSQVMDQIFVLVASLVKTCCGTCMAKSEFYQEMENYLFHTINIPYTRAVRRGVIKGLANYNILQNPKYKEAFAITDVFAMNHTRVKSLRHFEKLSFDDIQTSDSVAPSSIAPKRAKHTKHANPETLRLMNASLEVGAARNTEEEQLLAHDRGRPQPSSPAVRSGSSPLLMQLERHQQYAPLGGIKEDDDNNSVMSGSSNVTRVTGVLITSNSTVNNDEAGVTERPTSSERPTSALVEMRSVFGGSMSDRPPSIHGNPMMHREQGDATPHVNQMPSITSRTGQKAVKKASTSSSSSTPKNKKHSKSKPSANDQKHLEDFKEGNRTSSKKNKPKKKKDFMNSGNM